MNESTQVVFSYTGFDVAQRAHAGDAMQPELVAVTCSVPTKIEGLCARDGRPFIEPVTVEEGRGADGLTDGWWIATGKTDFEQICGEPVPVVEFVNVDTIEGDGDFNARAILKVTRPEAVGEMLRWWLEMFGDEAVARVWLDAEGMIRRHF